MKQWKKYFFVLFAVLFLGVSILCVVMHFSYEKSMAKICQMIERKNYAQLQEFIHKHPYYLNHTPISIQLYCAMFDTIAPNTPLQIACRYSDEVAVHILLEQGADPNYVPLMQGYYPLSIAAGRGNLKAVEALLEYGADVEIQGFQTFDAYLKYRKNTRNGNDANTLQHLLDLLTKKGFSIETKDASGDTLLSMAAVYGDIDAIDYFVNNTELSAHAQNNLSQTILHLYVKSGYNTPRIEGVQYLVDFGVDVTARDAYGKSARDYAVEKGYTEIADFLA